MNLRRDEGKGRTGLENVCWGVTSGDGFEVFWNGIELKLLFWVQIYSINCTVLEAFSCTVLNIIKIWTSIIPVLIELQG